MENDALNHFLDTNILIEYIESEPNDNKVIHAYMDNPLFKKCTSTTPYNEYRNLCLVIGKKTRKFLSEIQDNPDLMQTRNLKDMICNEFKIYARYHFKPPTSSFIRKKVTSFIRDNAPKIAEAVRNGRVFSEVIDDCKERVQSLVTALQGILASICHNLGGAKIELHTVEEPEREMIRNSSSFRPAFEHIKDELDSHVLAEACHIREYIICSNKLYLITRDRNAFLEILPKRDIIKHLKIYPSRPDDILKYTN